MVSTHILPMAEDLLAHLAAEARVHSVDEGGLRTYSEKVDMHMLYFSYIPTSLLCTLCTLKEEAINTASPCEHCEHRSQQLTLLLRHVSTALMRVA
jgi:hypothetical protein